MELTSALNGLNICSPKPVPQNPLGQGVRKQNEKESSCEENSKNTSSEERRDADCSKLSDVPDQLKNKSCEAVPALCNNAAAASACDNVAAPAASNNVSQVIFTGCATKGESSAEMLTVSQKEPSSLAHLRQHQHAEPSFSNFRAQPYCTQQRRRLPRRLRLRPVNDELDSDPDGESMGAESNRQELAFDLADSLSLLRMQSPTLNWSALRGLGELQDDNPPKYTGESFELYRTIRKDHHQGEVMPRKKLCRKEEQGDNEVCSCDHGNGQRCQRCSPKVWPTPSQLHCRQEAYGDDVTANELAAYIHHHLHLPQEMSDAAKMMYS